MPRIDRLWYEIDAETKGFEEGIGRADQKLRSFVEYAAARPGVVLGTVGVAMLAAGAKATVMAAQFEQGIGKISTVVDTTTVSLDRLRAGLLDTFASLPVDSVDELSQGLYDLLSSGIPAAEALETLNIAARGAIGGITSTKVAVDVITTALGAYRDAGLTAARANDILFAGVAVGKVEYAELAQTLGFIVPIASAYNIRLEEVVGATAALSLQGQSASIAVTGLRSAIANIINPTDEFRKLFPELAREFNGTKLEAVGLVEFLRQFTVASNGSKAALNALFTDIQGKNAILALTKNNMKGLTDAVDATTNSYGKAEEATKKMEGQTSALAKRIKNELTASFLELGESALPTVNDALGRFEGVVRKIRFATSSGETQAVRGLRNDLADLADAINDPILSLPRSGAILRNYGESIAAIMEKPQRLTQLTNDELRTFIGLLKSTQSELGPLAVGATEALRLVEREQARRQQVVDMAGLYGRGAPTAPLSPATEPPPPDPEALERARERAREVSEALKKLRDDAAEVTRLVDGEAVKATATLVDDLTLSLRQLVATLRDRGASEVLVRQVEALGEAAVRAQAAVEDADRSLAIASERTGRGDVAGALDALLAAETELIVAREREVKGSEAARVIEERRRRIHEQIVDLTKKSSDNITRGAQATNPAVERARDLASVIGQSANGALQLAEAFGLVDDRAARALRSIGDIAAAIPVATASGASLLERLPGIIGLAGGVAGLLSGAFRNDDPGAEERRRLQRENTEALRVLSERIGELGILDVTGSTFDRLDDALTGLDLDQARARASGSPTNQLARAAADPIANALARAGFGRDQLAALGQQFGVDVPTSYNTREEAIAYIEAIQRLREALQASEFSTFADTFAGQMQRLDATIALFDLDTAIEQLDAFRDALDNVKDGGGILAETIAQFDLSTAEGIEAARKAIQELFTALPGLDPSQLGGLTPQEFLDALNRLNGIITNAAGGGVDGTGGFNVSRTITEVTGNRLAGLLGTSNVFLEQIAASSALVARAFGGPAVGIVPPAPVTPGAGAAGGITIIVQVAPPYGMGEAEAEKLGRAAGGAAAREVSRALGTEARFARLASGNPIIPS